MKKLKISSFRERLFLSFLVISLVPMLLCSALLLHIFKVRTEQNAEEKAAGHLEVVCRSADALSDGFLRAASKMKASPVIREVLSGRPPEMKTMVYSILYEATEGVRSYARFDLYDKEGRWLCSTVGPPAAQELPTDWGILHKAGEGGGALVYAAGGKTPLYQGAALLRDSEGRPAGYFLITMDGQDFRTFFEGKYGVRNELIILNRYWHPVYASQPALMGETAELLRQRVLTGEAPEVAEQDFCTQIVFHEPTGLYFALRRPLALTQSIREVLHTVSLSSAIICVGISVILSHRFSHQLFLPIERMQKAIGEVEQDNLEVQLPPGENDELGQLTRRFNGMVEALRRNREELIRNQKELNEAQIRMLQAQLNPHFLCNTLDTMKWISKINRVPQVALLSTNLADLLRIAISPEEFVTLRREAELLERYIEIQRIRLSGALTFQVEIPLLLEDCLVPKMMLQPLVENAILHGLSGMENGTVTVEAAEDAGRLRVTVTDNGRGFPPEMAGTAFLDGRSQEKDRGHLGLYNVHTILKKHYGKDFGLYLYNRTGGQGAVVTAVLPLTREETAEC